MRQHRRRSKRVGARSTGRCGGGSIRRSGGRRARARRGRYARLAEALRDRAARALADQTEDAVTLERLHQDLVQSYTAGSLGLELAARCPMDAERTSRVVRDASEALARFERLSRAWSLLSSPDAESQRAQRLDALVGDLVDLYRTEASMLGVELRVGGAPTSCRVGRAACAARRIARSLEEAMRAAGAGGRVEIEVREGASVCGIVCPRHAPASTWSLGLQ